MEQCLNARPKTSASTDATDLNALTLNHFLLGTPSSSLPTHFQVEIDHRKRYVRAQAYSDAMWNTWLKEYVPTLNRRSKRTTPSGRELKTRDLVWIVEPTTPRGHYPLARVVKLNYGANSVAQSAEVKTSSGNLTRPIVKLFPSFPFLNKTPSHSLPIFVIDNIDSLKHLTLHVNFMNFEKIYLFLF